MPNQLLDTIVLFALIGVGATAVVALAWNRVTSRRGDAIRQDEGGSTIERRAVRGARLQHADDPIVAALGLHDADAGPPVELEGRLPGRDEGVHR
jgi:hypothetical protein